jgi:hypothetical protein
MEVIRGRGLRIVATDVATKARPRLGRRPTSGHAFIVFFGFSRIFGLPSGPRGAARPILDDKWLAEPLGQPLTH